MAGPIDPIRASQPSSPSRRRTDRGALTAPAADQAPEPQLRVDPAPAPPPATKASAAFAAQLIAGSQRRGLRGGSKVLSDAKSAYLGAEWSGDADRRARSGRLTKTEI